MKHLFLVVLFSFLVFIYPAQQLNQFDYQPIEQPTITELDYLPDFNMTPYTQSVSLEKQKVLLHFVPLLSAVNVQIHPPFIMRNLSLKEIRPDAHGFLGAYAFQSNYFSNSILY